MSITDLTEKLHAAESEIIAAKGSAPSLFALFLREDALGRWDLVVAAPWTRSNQQLVLKELGKIVLKHLGTAGVRQLSRIVLSDPDSPEVRAINRSINVQTGSMITLRDSTLFDMPIKEAVILTSSSG